MTETGLLEVSLAEGLEIAIVSIAIVFFVLIGLMLILMSFKYIFKEAETKKTVSAAQGVTPGPMPLQEDEETKEVAALMALIEANKDLQDKKYQITSIKRIK